MHGDQLHVTRSAGITTVDAQKGRIAVRPFLSN